MLTQQQIITRMFLKLPEDFSILRYNRLTPCIVSAHALPLFREDRPRSSKKRQEKDRKDPVKSRRPDLPVTGPGEWMNLAFDGSFISDLMLCFLARPRRTHCCSRWDLVILYNKKYGVEEKSRRWPRSERGHFEICKRRSRESLLDIASLCEVLMANLFPFFLYTSEDLLENLLTNYYLWFLGCRTQPKPIFNVVTEEEEEPPTKKQK